MQSAPLDVIVSTVSAVTAAVVGTRITPANCRARSISARRTTWVIVRP